MIEATGPARGFVAECPELATLEAAPLAPWISEHVDVCDSCQLVIELLAERADESSCERFEPLLAARADGTNGRAAANLLARHLAGCADCRDLAESIAPTADVEGDHATLPRIEPDSYALGLEIGKGGMGRVLAARDLRIGRPVAVKELLARSPQLAARFEREARITARLQHPGIVPIYEIGRWPDGTPFYSMRMVDGHTLRDAIATASSLAQRVALVPAVIAATEAVAFAHAQRIIHRDLTPSNVLVGAYGETVVIDWGLAKDVSTGATESVAIERGPAESGELTNAGAVIGTAAYMPPEQANAKAVDERADVYALGAILYHVLAGTAPYLDAKPASVLDAVKAGPPSPIDVVAAAAPRDLRSIVAKAMAREPSERYPSARELAEELVRFQTGRMVEAHQYSTLERMRRFVSRNRAAVVVTAIAAVAMSALGFVAVRRVVRERSAAVRNVAALLEEEGRSELLAGDSQRALAYFDAAFASGSETPSLRFMRAAAMRDLTNVVGDLECGNDVRDLSFTPDKTMVVASCHDVAKAWRLSDRKLVATFELDGITDGFDHVELSHDGARVVTYGGDGVARMWDAATGNHVRDFVHLKSGDVLTGRTITFATFTPDDKHLATTGYDGWWRYWDTTTGALVREGRGSDAVVLKHLYGVLSRDGSRLLTFTIEGHGAGWDVASGTQIATVEHGSIAGGGALSPDGTLAATCGVNRLVKVWDTSSPKLIIQLAGASDTVFACKFSEDGKRVIGTSQDGHAYVWNVADGAIVSTANHGKPVWTGHFSPDGARYVTVAFDGSIAVWDTETGGLLEGHDTHGGHEARFSPDGALLLAARGDGRIRIWRNTGPLRGSEPGQVVVATLDGTRAVVETPAGAELRDTATHGVVPTRTLTQPFAATADRIAGTNGTQVIVVDARTGTTLVELDVNRHPSALAFAGDGERIAVQFEQAPPEVWDLRSRTPRARLANARYALLDASGASAIAWGGDDVRVWNVDAGTARAALPRPSGAVDDPDAAEADVEVPIGFAERAVVLFDAHRHTATLWRDGDVETVSEVATAPQIAPGGRFVTMVLRDHTVKTLDIEARGEAAAFVGDQLLDAQPDPSGQLLAAIDASGTAALVLDAHDGRVLARWPIVHASLGVTQSSIVQRSAIARWSPDGRAVVSRTARQLARWSADLDVRDPDGRVIDDAALSRLVRAKVAWHVVGAKLVRSTTSWHAVLYRDGVPLAGQQLTLVFRKPAQLGGDATTWQSAAFKNTTITLTSDAGGQVARDDMPPGTYKLVCAGRAYLLDIDIDDTVRTIDLDELQAIPVTK